MKLYSASNIRNVVIAGHGGRGKTTLAEAMLFIAGASDRFGKVADGNTVIFAAKYGRDTGIAAKTVSFVSFASVLTMPVMIALTQI